MVRSTTPKTATRSRWSRSEIPLSELFGYTTAIRGMSQGRASATMEFLEYRPMPAGMMKEMLEEKAGGKAKK